MSRGSVLAVVGGQYGSEGKGVLVHYLADRYHIHVRTGGPNAGHSFYHEGKLYKMQQLPCGFTNPGAILVIGPGAVVDLEILVREIEMVKKQFDPDIYDRVYVSTHAAVIDSRHHGEEGGIHGELHQRIGSTGEGVGAARLARIQRDPEKIKLVKDVLPWGENGETFVGWGWTHSNVPKMLSQALASGENILLEGTQGSGLSLIHGPWPYVTSADTNAAQLAADAGIPPHHLTEILLVVRSHPIRVAGNSGPLKNETSWEAISEHVGKEVEERTTVTKKVRRVGQWDEALVDQAVILNAPTHLALTFADYIDPNDTGKTAAYKLSNPVQSFVRYLETRYETPVALIGTGGENWNVVDLGLL